jgi:hypothetical protein
MRMQVGAPLGSKAIGDLAESDAVAQRPLRSVVGGGMAWLVTKTNKWRRILLTTRCGLTPIAGVGTWRMISSRREQLQ